MSQTTESTADHTPENGALTQIEWGVRFPSGNVESYGSNEQEARRFAITTTALRPDLPTLVVRQVVTPWEVPRAADPQACVRCAEVGYVCYARRAPYVIACPGEVCATCDYLHGELDDSVTPPASTS